MMAKEFITLEYWNKYDGAKKHAIGSCNIDFMTAATGPVRHILCFYGVEDKTKVVGSIVFDLFIEEMKNVDVNLNVTVTPLDKRTDISDYYLEISQILKSEQKRKKGKGLVKTNTLKKLRTESFIVEHIPYPNTTLKALDNEIIQITLKTKKKK